MSSKAVVVLTLVVACLCSVDCGQRDDASLPTAPSVVASREVGNANDAQGGATTLACTVSLTYFRTESGAGCPNNAWVCSRIALSGCTGASITLTNPSGVALTYSDPAWTWARACNCKAAGEWKTRGWSSKNSAADKTWKKTF
jgi:hypothetical protein